MNIEGTETTKIAPLLGENNYIRIEQSNIDDKLDEIFSIIIDIISKTNNAETVIGTTVEIAEFEKKLDEGKEIVDKTVTELESKSNELEVIL